ncbi:Swi5-domain-containing protein [Aspergillus pseudodeflectus]|uniref:Swi5-domain-containing protein n=1 Tax=Aspergillus pseudodeflectus TaxID=176178 RepID=A0ABR4KRR1_9EURO
MSPKADPASPAPKAQQGESPSTPRQASQRGKKLETLRATNKDLESQVAAIESQVAEIRAKLKNDPSETVKRHIRLLHEYNEIKDVGQGLIGLIADARGMRQVDVEREFGVCEKD